METISKKGRFTLKQILKENWDSFLVVHGKQATWYMAFNVWKVMSCREPDGLGFNTYACPDLPGETCYIPRSC
ncbi:MAG: hypothetical protein HQL78_11930 [Magnetococcales bacterium]|nr:hypothetical protein [Magnetococcales bacterium]